MSTARSDDHASLDPRVERTRQAALAAALGLLLDEGWDALTHVRLASASGVSRMTLYRHWPTRLDLLYDALQEAADVRHAPISGDLRQDLKSELQLMRTQFLSPARAKLLATLLEHAQSDDKIARLRNDLIPKGCKGLSRILEAAVELGTLPPDFDVDEGVTLLVGPCVYKVLVNGRQLTPAFVDDVAEHFLDRYEQPGTR